MRNWRINLIFISLFLFGAAIIGRLIYIQILQGDFFMALAQGQQKIFQYVEGERGEIYFRNGQTLAINVKEKYVFVLPQEIREKEKTAKTISQVLNLDENLVLEKFKKNNNFAEIKTGLSKEEEDSLKKLKLKGVYIDEGTFRKYPQGMLASNIIGFLGGEGKGQYGIEGYYDDVLQGKETLAQKEESVLNYFPSNISQEFGKGADLILTIDYNIQFMAEKLLARAKEEFAIEGGEIIVMEPNSGKVLALASFPNFDPNHYSEVGDFQVFQNASIQKFFEPGSIFKSITMAAALDQEKINPQTTYVDKGFVQIGEHTLYNFGRKTWGERTMAEVLERSINTGAIFVENQLGHKFFLEYIKRFGFFEPTGIDLQGEVFSENQEIKKGYEVNFATASFGQGIGTTPIQIARAFCAIANGGKLVRPYVVDKIIQNGNTVESQLQISYDGVISQKTASQLTAMLVSVVENGSGKKAKVAHYHVAGKTGTAQIPWSNLGENKKGYSEKTWQSFIGFAPAFNPSFVILVKLDNPQAPGAEYSTAPIFQELAKYTLDYLGIPPDYD